MSLFPERNKSGDVDSEIVQTIRWPLYRSQQSREHRQRHCSNEAVFHVQPQQDFFPLPSLNYKLLSGIDLSSLSFLINFLRHFSSTSFVISHQLPSSILINFLRQFSSTLFLTIQLSPLAAGGLHFRMCFVYTLYSCGCPTGDVAIITSCNRGEEGSPYRHERHDVYQLDYCEFHAPFFEQWARNGIPLPTGPKYQGRKRAKSYSEGQSGGKLQDWKK